MLAEDQEIITRFLRHESEAAHVIEGWIARAASPFRQRLGLQWEDVLQEVSLEVTRLLERGSFRGESSLKTYLWRIVNHACINQLRQLRKLRTQAQTHWMEFEDLVELAVSPDGSPLDQLLQKESERLLLRVLSEMSAECRSLWGMIFDGLSYQQMSQRLGASEGALRVKALRCRQRAVAVREELIGKKI